MKNARRTLSATAILAVAILAGSTPVFAAGIANVAATGAHLRSTTSMPIYLPSSLPNSIVGGGGVRMTFTSARASEYDASIIAGRKCTNATCRIGFMRGMQAPVGTPAGEPVRFEGSRTAYFVAANCTRGCTAGTLTWTSGGFRYVLGIRGASLNALRFTAASAARY